jgi:hypothetical protein
MHHLRVSVITGRPVTVAAAFAAEKPGMMPLPDEMFDTARLLQAMVDNRARVCVRQNYYSVPARYAGRCVAVRLSAMSVQALRWTGRGLWPCTRGRPAGSPPAIPAVASQPASFGMRGLTLTIDP